VKGSRHAITMWEGGFASCGECAFGSRALWCKRQSLKEFASGSEFASYRLSDVCVAQQQPGLAATAEIEADAEGIVLGHEGNATDVVVNQSSDLTKENQPMDGSEKQKVVQDKASKQKLQPSEKAAQKAMKALREEEQLDDKPLLSQYEPIGGILASATGKLIQWKKDNSKPEHMPWRVWVQKDPKATMFVTDIRVTCGNYQDYCDSLWQSPGFGYRVVAQHCGSGLGGGMIRYV
jgi:hypothetical protein